MAKGFPMIAERRRRWLTGVLAGITIGATACRDTAPPPLHNRDLGGDGVVLLPTAPMWHDSAIAEGRADWYAFREPAIEEESGTDEAPRRAAPVQGNQVEAAIREMIDEYNGFVPEATVDDLLEYYAEEQHDVLKPLFEAATSFAQIYTAIRA